MLLPLNGEARSAPFQNWKRATIVPARWPVTEPLSGVTGVPKPPLYKPVLGPEVNFVGACAKLPRLIPPGAVAVVGICRRLKMFVNSTRMFRL